MSVLLLLGEMALRTLLLCGIGAITLRVFGTWGADIRHAVLRIALAGMVTLPLLTAILPPLSILPAARIATWTAPATAFPKPAPFAAGSTSSGVASESGPVTTAESYFETTPMPALWPALFVWVYLAGVALLLSRTALGVRRARWTASKAALITDPEIRDAFPERAGLDLRESRDITVPFTYGWRRAIVVLPGDWRQWNRFKLRSVLVHETGHVARADWLTAVAAAINRSLHWYNPLAWWLERGLGALAEEACDARAIASLGDRERYARIVLDFAQVAGLHPGLQTASMARASRVGRRITEILEGRVRPGRALSKVVGAAILALALPVVYAAAALQFAPDAAVRETSEDAPALSRTEFLSVGWNTTPEDAERLEAVLVTDPENLTVRGQLVSYYHQYMNAEARGRHLLWLIEHHPEAAMFQFAGETSMTGYTFGMTTPVDAERARGLWLLQMERFPIDTRVLSNAARALDASDPIVSLELVRRARRVEPESLEWVNWLGAIYARAVRVAFAGGRENIGPIRGTAGGPAFYLPLSESQQLKNELETSDDIALIRATGNALLDGTPPTLPEQFTANRGARLEEMTTSRSFGILLLARALELEGVTLSPAVAETEPTRPARVLVVELEGFRQTPLEVVRYGVRTQEGEAYDPDLVRRDVQVLSAFPHIESVRAETETHTEGVIVRFTATELP